MPDLTVYLDISGRVTNATEHGGHLTAVAVAVDESQIASVRSKMPNDFPKWGRAGPLERRHALVMVALSGIYIGIYSVDRDTPEWRALIEDSEIVQQAIRKQKGKV